ncbi:MAG: hypothetical protein IAE79_02785, partial [Anaerolinea sp.]|nr:hypothetical protein [Anaerolinea sp.]
MCIRDRGRTMSIVHTQSLTKIYGDAAHPVYALENLQNLREDFDVYTELGFYDAVNVETGEVAQYYLALDQGMIMAALGNYLRNDRLQHYFTHGEIEQAIRPLLAMEQFTAGVSGAGATTLMPQPGAWQPAFLEIR